MKRNLLDLHRNFIETQKLQIKLANQLIKYANYDIKIIVLANEIIKGCEKAISIEQNMMNNYEN